MEQHVKKKAAIQFIKYLFDDKSVLTTRMVPNDSDTVMFRQIVQDPALAEFVMHIIDEATRINNVTKKEVLCHETEIEMIEHLPNLIMEIFMYIVH